VKQGSRCSSVGLLGQQLCSSGAVVLLPCQPAAAVCCLLPARCTSTAVRLYCWPLLSVALSVSQRPRLLRHCLAAGCCSAAPVDLAAAVPTPAQIFESLARLYEYSPCTHFAVSTYSTHSTALPFFLDSGGLGPRDGFVSSAPISSSQLSR
jgi:hypothetical protein